MKYEHRAVIIRLAREFFYHGHVNGDGDLPPGWTVHHQDFDKRNNQPGNLIVMSVGFHAEAGTARNHRTQERDERGRFLPSWVLRDEVGAGEEWGEGRE